MNVVINLTDEKRDFLDKWAPPSSPAGPNFARSFERALDDLLDAACRKSANKAVQLDRIRITAQIRRMLSVDLDRIVEDGE